MVQHNRAERTDPYFVRVRSSENVLHLHERFGRPVWGRHPVRDASGDPVLRTEHVEMTLRQVLRDPFATVPQQAVREARMMRSRGAGLDEVIAFDVQTNRPLYEWVAKGAYADWCTAGEPVARTGELVGHPGAFAPCIRKLHGTACQRAFPRHKGDRRTMPGRDNARRRAIRDDEAASQSETTDD